MSAQDEDETDWPAIRIAYEGSDLTVEGISQRFNLTKDRMYRRAHKEGWQGRRDDKTASPDEPDACRTILRQAKVLPPEPAPRESDQPTPTQKRAALAARLFHALEERIMAIEDDSASRDAAHGERDAKALSAMARALEQLSDMLEQAAPATTPNQAQEIDVDEFRKVLTDRLDRLRTGGRER